ncbi:hypothetical protein AGMMS50293_27490 [Spirochaetia bacterium]|nr:hypothetical protein AGMMS50293_27490 [Spirochaetia bacterium]
MFKKISLIITIFCLPAYFLPAQTAERMDILLSSPEVSCAIAALAVLPAAALIPEDSSPEAAFAAALEQGVLPKNAEADKAIKLDELSFLIMRSFGMKSGLMYALFPSPRYAYREMIYRKLIQGRNDHALTLSGERLLRILGRTLDFLGESALGETE